jgi:membrane protein YfhO
VFLLILRLLAVYFGAVAAVLVLAHRFVAPIRPRAGVFLSLGPFLLVGKALLTAGVYAPIDIPYQAEPLASMGPEVGVTSTRNPALGDVVYQEIPWRKAVREAVKNGRLPLWNRFVLAGEPLLAVQQPAVFHPATWLGFLLPLAQAWTLEMALRYFLALVSAYLFLRDLRCGELAALFGAAGWAFCDYLVFFAGYPLTPAAAPFPLLLLGLRRLVTEGSRRAVALTVVALLLILTSGHPETLLHCFAGAGIYFLFELAWAGKGRRLRPFRLSLLAGILTLGLGAVLLLPLVEALPHTAERYIRTNFYAHARRSAALKDSIRRVTPDFLPFYYGFSGKGLAMEGYNEPGSYAGSVILPFAALGLFSRRREKWPILVVGLLGIAVGARLRGVMDAICALPGFDIGINERMVFLGTFATAALAALGMERLREEGGARVLVAATLACLGLLVFLYFHAQPHLHLLQMPQGYFLHRTLVFGIPLVLGAVVWLALRGPRRETGFAVAAILLLLAQRRLEEGDFYPTYPNRAFYPPQRALDAIPRNAPFRMTAVGYTFIPNIAALYEVEDVRGYEAMTFRRLFDTSFLWCVPQPVWYNRIDDPTRPFLSFLNVRYFLLPPGHPPPPEWKVLFSGAEGQLVENPRVLPRAFVPRSLKYATDGAETLKLLEGVREFAGTGIVEESRPPEAADGGEINGHATVEIVSYEPQRMMLDISAAQPSLVATSVTAWPGWKLTIDDAPAKLVGYNYAFLAFRVAAGRHTAVLRYMPDGFLDGSGITVVTLAVAIVLAWRTGRAVPPRA